MAVMARKNWTSEDYERNGWVRKTLRLRKEVAARLDEYRNGRALNDVLDELLPKKRATQN